MFLKKAQTSQERLLFPILFRKEVLRKEKREMTISEIWDYAVEHGLDKKLISVGNTPKNTLNASIRRHIGNAKHVRFKQTMKRPAKYYLND